MTLHEPHTATTTGDLHLSSSHAGQNNIKKLKSKYASKLAIIKELFENWSDEDLLFAIQDADGDLELTIERISEGHVVQWGEVKSKKSKKEAPQKAKGAHQTAPFSSSGSQRVQHHHPERGGRPGRGDPHGARGSGKTTQHHQTLPHQTHATSWAKKSRPSAAAAAAQQSDLSTGGSWASIASAPKPAMDDNAWSGQNQNTTDEWKSSSNTTTNNDSWGTPLWSNEAPSTTTDRSHPSITNIASSSFSSSSSNNIANNTTSSPSEPKKTWASLLKSKPEPQTKEAPPPPPAVENDNWSAPASINNNNNSTDNNWDSSVTELKDDRDDRNPPASNSNNINTWKDPTSDDNWASSKDGWGTPPVSENGSNSISCSKDIANQASKEDVTYTAEKEEEPKDIIDPAVDEPVTTTVVTDATPADKEQTGSPALEIYAAKPKHTSRRLKQDVAVVLPTMTSASFAAVDLRFGSLRLDESSIKQVEPEARPEKQEPPNEEPPSQQHYTDCHPANTPARNEQSNALSAPEILSDQPSYLKQESSLSYVQQQQQYGMDHLTSAYSSYMSGHQPTGVSGFNMNPMGVPEFGIYGAEAQRAAAAAMGYYDPSGYNHSPSVTATANTYPTRDKFGQQDGPQSSGGAAQTQAMPQPQQMYAAAANLPYYQYYYMANGFGGYQQNTYGQPVFNKNMYPAVYQQSSGKSVTGSPYGAAAGGSPYQGQHLYNSPSGYDDMTPLQQPMVGGAGGLHEYHQKPSSYGSGPGFLSNLSGSQQQQHQQQAPSQGSQSHQQRHQPTPVVQQQQQGPGKPDLNNGQYKSSGSQQGGVSQQQHNYFNHQQTQHMFYAQQQQQFPVQYNPRQPQHGHQQYWSQ